MSTKLGTNFFVYDGVGYTNIMRASGCAIVAIGKIKYMISLPQHPVFFRLVFDHCVSKHQL